MTIKIILDLQIEQRGTERFAVGVERERPRHAAAQRLAHDKIQRGNVGQLIADNLAFDNTGKLRLHAFAGDLRQQQRIMLLVIGDHGDVGGIALVAGAGMGDLAQLHHHPHKLDRWFCQFARQQDRCHRDHIARRFERAAAGRRAVGVERFDLVADSDGLAQIFGAAGDANTHLVRLVGVRGDRGSVQGIDADQLEAQFACRNAGQLQPLAHDFQRQPSARQAPGPA